jgi:SAM-dependent methyltransferase
MGFKVVGVDESESMLQQGQQRLRAAAPEVRSRVRFLNKDLRNNGLESGSWDAVTALGVIGYLPNDDVLFAEAARLLRPDGVFILSCRNRLFNMVSISEYTLREIEQGSAKQLVEEIQELFQQAPEGDVLNFLRSLASVSNQLVSELAQESLQKEDPAPPTFTTSIEARQHTPKQVLDTAKSLGFQYEAFYGVHPHLLMAGLNRSLPPTTFNVLASSLETLHHLPISLIWSSVFLGVFRKIP